MRIRDYFDVERASDEQLMLGPKDGVLFSPVATQYLNGFINYCNIVKAYMINSYMFENDWEQACARVDLLPEQFHTNISDATQFDTTIILAENEEWWFFFDSDSDGSYCALGKLSKAKYNREQIIVAFKNEAIEKSKEENYLKKIKEMGPEHFTGWITL